MRCAAVVCDGTGSLDAPLILHGLITGACNGSCDGCRYRRASGELDRGIDWWIQRVEEFADLGGRTFAIGGGEPTLVDGLQDLVDAAKARGLIVSMTTNGVLRRVVEGLDLVHVSCDDHHPLSQSEVVRTVEFYRGFVPSVGVNVVLWSDDDLRHVRVFPRSTLIMPKPWWSDPPAVDEIASLIGSGGDVMADSCLATWMNQERYAEFRTPCLQGRVSMCIDDIGRASVCSHAPDRLKVEAGTVAEMWNAIRLRGGAWEGKTLGDCLASWNGVGSYDAC